MTRPIYEIKTVASKIRESGNSIYDELGPDDSEMWLASPELEALLDDALIGMDLTGLPLRTRSKVVKEAVCKALGYPVPKSFKKTQPRFPAQDFDTYIQKANNLQVWNEDLSASRRYVILKVTPGDEVEKVKVVDGATLAKLDRTGTLTQKYQARFDPSDQPCELVSAEDTVLVRSILMEADVHRVSGSPTNLPTSKHLLPIKELFERLSSLVGQTCVDPGHDQERNRGSELHRMICKALGYSTYHDDGTFPDITEQIAEVKLQTSPTIDLGLVTPNSTEHLDVPAVDMTFLRHCDVRYVLFYGETDGACVTLTHLAVATGEDFFTRFPQFGGKVLNKKLQIPLPRDFFDS
jgi:hypothetical protein